MLVKHYVTITVKLINNLAMYIIKQVACSKGI